MNAKRVGVIGGATALAVIIAIVVVALVGGFDSNDEGSSASNTIHQIYQREGWSVYFVQSSGPDGVGTGTAWLYDDAGHLVTNEHVISGGTDIAIRVGDNRLVPVEVVGEDQSTDLAVEGRPGRPQRRRSLRVGRCIRGVATMALTSPTSPSRAPDVSTG